LGLAQDWFPTASTIGIITYRGHCMSRAMMSLGTRTTTLNIMKSKDIVFTCFMISTFLRNACMDQCPSNTHCEWGFCECNAGLTKSWGQCTHSSQPLSTARAGLKHSALPCDRTGECQAVDINMVCTGTTCTCRKDMQWNSKAMECQILLDVDCTATTFSSPVAPLVKATVEQCTDLMDTGSGAYNFMTDCEGTYNPVG